MPVSWYLAAVFWNFLLSVSQSLRFRVGAVRGRFLVTLSVGMR